MGSELVANLYSYLRTKKISAKYLHDLWTRAQLATVNVLGDPLIDVYIDVVPAGLAKGHPVINWREIGRRVYAGGCCKVAKDISYQCQEVNIGTFSMPDFDYSAKFFPPVRHFYTTEKIRFLHDGHHIFRHTIEHHHWSEYPESMPKADVTVLSLFGFDGPISPINLKRLAGNSLVVIDSQNPEFLKNYEGHGFVLFATENEFLDGRCSYEGWKTVFLKNGSEGCQIISDHDHVPALCKNPIDSIGSGDAFLATASIMLACYRGHYHEAAILGSIAAAIHCSRPGNGTVIRDDIDEVLNGCIDLQREEAVG